MKGMALILYNNIEYAQAAVKDTKGWKIGGSKIKVNDIKRFSHICGFIVRPAIRASPHFFKVDFANQESQMAFYRSMQASGQDIRDFYDILSERRCVFCKSTMIIFMVIISSCTFDVSDYKWRLK